MPIDEEDFYDLVEPAFCTLRCSSRLHDDFVRAVKEVRDALHRSPASEGPAPSRAKLMTVAANIVFFQCLTERRIASLVQRGMRDDGDMASILAMLSGKTHLRRAGVHHVTRATVDILLSNSFFTSRESACRYARLLATRAFFLEKNGVYRQAISDCEAGLEAVARNEPAIKPMLGTTLILEASLALSKLKAGDRAHFHELVGNACATFSAWQASDHGPAATEIVNATIISLTTSQTRLRSAESLPSGLDRSKQLLSLCPGSFEAFLDLLKELLCLHQYQLAADACEHWAFSAMHRCDLLPASFKFLAPSPSVQFDLLAEDNAGAVERIAARRLSADEVRRHAADPEIFPSEMVPLYLMALHMTDQRDKGRAALAGVVTNREFEESVLASLEERDAGEIHRHSGAYAEALKHYEESNDLLPSHRMRNYNCHMFLKAILDFNIGFCRYKLEDPKGAIRSLSKCLKSVPDYMYALSLRATCYWALGNLDRAISDSESFLCKYDNALGSEYPTVCSIRFPHCIDALMYQKVKSNLDIAKAENSGVAPRRSAMADATNRSCFIS